MIVEKICHQYDATSWKILVIENRFPNYQSSKYLLDKINILGHDFDTMEEFSFELSKQVLKDNNDISIVIMDVILNGDYIGIKLIDYIRKELQNEKIRIIIRTNFTNIYKSQMINKKYNIDGFIYEDMANDEDSLIQMRILLMGAIQTYNQCIIVSDYIRDLAESVTLELRNSLTLFSLNFSALKNQFFHLKKKYPNENIDLFNTVLKGGIRLSKRSDLILNMIHENIVTETLDRDKFKLFSVAKVVNSTFNDFFDSYLFANKISLNIENDFMVYADKQSFAFVLFNLFKNSLFYIINKPNIKIQIKLERKENENILFYIDNGHGIHEDKLSSLFDITPKEDRVVKGLGLYFCKRVMRKLGGEIKCSSQFRHWTQFELIFPVYEK